MSDDDKIAFTESTFCHICTQPFSDIKFKCHDHCHLTGKFRGAAHMECNLQLKFKKRIPVILHNFKSYDSHLIIHGFNKFGDKFRVIPNNSKNYLSVSVDNITFIDSLQFLPCNLETLVNNLKSENDPGKHFTILKQKFGDKYQLLLRKGVFPYDYFDAEEKFKEATFPPKSAFLNSLTGKEVSDEDYSYGLKIFQKFGLKNLGEYHDLYLLTDTILLACVFENFRHLMLNNYQLDPCHYVSLPGIAWDAALKMSGVKLDQLVDIDMYEFYERGIRGGVSQICTRKANANKKYMSNYDCSKPSSFIMYWDKNNLYGESMLQPLPRGDFEWVNVEGMTSVELSLLINNVNAHEGYVFEVDLSYPKHLHEKHNDLPLAAEKITVAESFLGKYQKKILKSLDIKYTSKQTKLIPHLGERKNYIIHYQILKYYLNSGLEIKKIHKAIRFTQSPWLAKYIHFNAEKRKLSKNEFEKSFFKLMNNAVFGKTMENKRKRIRVELSNDLEKALWYVSKPHLKSWERIENDLCSFILDKKTVHLDRPVYVGFCILELAKLSLYEFHYQQVKKWYGEKAKLLFTDTDSLCYHIETNDIYKDMSNHQEYFDTSGYPKTHFLYSQANKKVIGKMKDEVNGQIISEFIGLGPKCYSLLIEGVSKTAAKGVPYSVCKNHLNHTVYKDVLLSQQKLMCKCNMIQTDNKHHVYTSQVVKTALHCFDSKRFICDDGISTLAYGHALI